MSIVAPSKTASIALDALVRVRHRRRAAGMIGAASLAPAPK
jgi:hypothetical protein